MCQNESLISPYAIYYVLLLVKFYVNGYVNEAELRD